MISRYSAKKPMTVVVAVIAIIILGFISFRNMTVDLLPSMELPYVVVYTTYPGASPEKVEASVTEPLEKALATTGGLEEMSSISSENISIVIMQFSYSTNMDSAMLEMSGSIDMVEPYFDDLVGTPTLMKINPDMIPVVISSVDYDGMDSAELSTFVEDTVIPALERIDGVASVSTSGIVEKSISITIREEKVDELNEKIAEEIENSFKKTEGALYDASAQLNTAKQQLNEKREELAQGKVQIEDGIAQLEAALAAIPVDKATLEEQKNQLTAAIALLNESLAAAEAGGDDASAAVLREQISQQNAQLDQINATIATIDELETKLAELNSAKSDLTASEPEVQAQFASAEKQISDAEAQISSGHAKLKEAKKDALEQADVAKYITSDMLNGILAADNFSMPAGYLGIGDDAEIVKVGEQFVSLEELESLVLMDMGMDNVGEIKLTDVADIEITDNSGESFAKINGNDGIILSIEKQSISSTVEVANAIAEAKTKLEAQYDGLHITALSDQGDYINILTDSVISNLLLGGLLAIIILLIFLRSIRPTLIIAVSIPVSLMFAVVMMYFSGVTINLISLAGLALAVGMLVDNSIVVIENVFRLRSEGAEPMTAAIEGANQVAGAVFASTLTTICVFLPIVFTQGLSKQLFSDMGLTIAYSLVASLIIALTVVPAMSRPMLGNYRERRYALWDKFVSGYGKTLSGSLKVKPAVLAIAVALMAYAGISAANMGLAFIPDSDTWQVSASITMDEPTTTEELRDTAVKVMERIEQVDGVETVGAMEGGGLSIMSMDSGSSDSMSLYIILSDDRKESSKEICRRINKCGEGLGCTVEAAGSGMNIEYLTGSGITVYVKGEDIDDMREAGKDIAAILEGVEGTTEITDLDESAASELRVIIDKNKALAKGLTVAQVYASVSERLADSQSATTITIDSVDYPVTVYDDSVEALDLEGLESYVVGQYTDEDGEEQDIALSDIAQITEAEGLASISRSNQVRHLTISAGIADGYNVSLVSRELQDKIDAYVPPTGVDIELSGENEMIVDTMKDLITMVLLAVALIYLIMVAQFQSLLSPFIVLFTIPLAFTGGLLSLKLCGMEISVISMLGFLVLAGVIVNNGIVLVDYINKLRENGMAKREAIVLAAKTRLRPILMTAITTILGLSTVALGIGEGADMLQPLAVVTIGGLIYATFMTLFVVPALYDIFNKEKNQYPELAEAADGAAVPAIEAAAANALPEAEQEQISTGDIPENTDEAAADIQDEAVSLGEAAEAEIAAEESITE